MRQYGTKIDEERYIKSMTIKLVNDGVIKKHPTKRFIVHIDGNITNWDINNLGWTNMNYYMAGVELGKDSKKGVFAKRFNDKFNIIEERIRKGNIILCKNL